MMQNSGVTEWLGRLNCALEARNSKELGTIFGPECYWRDRLAFTWNIKTMEGRDEIAGMLAQAPPARFGLAEVPKEADGFMTAWLTFDTNVGRGKAHLRLKDGLAFTLLTSLEELKGFEERSGTTREKGIVHGTFKNRENWLERKTADETALGLTVQPYCVIIGGGQGGYRPWCAPEATRCSDYHTGEECPCRRFLAQPLPLTRVA
jgi:putative flavoprotein involved in K+ transport